MVKWQCRHLNLLRFSGKSTSWRWVQEVILRLILCHGDVATLSYAPEAAMVKTRVHETVWLA
jgi:hypothetical protein